MDSSLNLSQDLYSQAAGIKARLTEYQTVWHELYEKFCKGHEELFARGARTSCMLSCEEVNALRLFKDSLPSAWQHRVEAHLKGLTAPVPLILNSRREPVIPLDLRIYLEQEAGVLAGAMFEIFQDESLFPVIYRRDHPELGNFELGEEMLDCVCGSDLRDWEICYPVKLKKLKLSQWSFPMVVLYPDCRAIIYLMQKFGFRSNVKAIADEEMHLLDELVIEHMEQIERDHPMDLIEMALDHTLIRSMYEFAKRVDAARACLQLHTDLNGDEIRDRLRADFIQAGDNNAPHNEESVVLNFIKQLYVIEGKEALFDTGMKVMAAMPALDISPASHRNWYRDVLKLLRRHNTQIKRKLKTGKGMKNGLIPALTDETGLFITKIMRLLMQSNYEQLPAETALPVLFVKLLDRMVVGSDPKELIEF